MKTIKSMITMDIHLLKPWQTMDEHKKETILTACTKQNPSKTKHLLPFSQFPFFLLTPDTFFSLFYLFLADSTLSFHSKKCQPMLSSCQPFLYFSSPSLQSAQSFFSWPQSGQLVLKATSTAWPRKFLLIFDVEMQNTCGIGEQLLGQVHGLLLREWQPEGW